MNLPPEAQSIVDQEKLTLVMPSSCTPRHRWRARWPDGAPVVGIQSDAMAHTKSEARALFKWQRRENGLPDDLPSGIVIERLARFPQEQG